MFHVSFCYCDGQQENLLEMGSKTWDWSVAGNEIVYVCNVCIWMARTRQQKRDMKSLRGPADEAKTRLVNNDMIKVFVI